MIGRNSHWKDISVSVVPNNFRRGAKFLDTHHSEAGPVCPIQVLIKMCKTEWVWSLVHPRSNNPPIIPGIINRFNSINLWVGPINSFSRNVNYNK